MRSVPLAFSSHSVMPGFLTDTRLLRQGAVVACAAAIGWLGGQTWQHRSDIVQLWYEASEQRYLTMTGDVGPVTYLITHGDYQTLESAALALDDVLGIEIQEFPDVSAIAFINGDSPAIAKVAELNVVERMVKTFVPMICH